MTISSTSRIAGPFAGNGSAASFPFTFKVFDETDLLVETLNVSTSAIAALALTTNYTVTLNVDQDATPGGSITLTGGNLATGFTLIITTDIPELQNLDLVNGGLFYPDTVNDALDLLTVLVQQLMAQVSRCVQIPLVDSGIDTTLPPAAARVGLLLGFDGGGAPELVEPGSGGGGGGGGTLACVPCLGTTPGTAFTTPTNVSGEILQVFYRGVLQRIGVGLDCTVSGNNITMNSTVTAPPQATYAAGGAGSLVCVPCTGATPGTAFATPTAVSVGVLQVFYRGVLQRIGVGLDCTVSGNNITMNYSVNEVPYATYQ
jgi:hypothetical protein